MELLKPGDTVGIVSPSHVADRAEYQSYARGLEKLGLQVRLGENIDKDTWGYVAGARERADDFNAMVRDGAVKMVFFGGGQGAVDLLPLLDYQAIRRSPKLYLSYSDGTSILDAIYAKTGIVTYYGQTPALYSGVSPYDLGQFTAHFLRGGPAAHTPGGPWRTVAGGALPGLPAGRISGEFCPVPGQSPLPLPPGQKVHPLP